MVNNVVKGLTNSMTQKEMVHLVRRIIPDYDLHKRMGLSSHHAVAHGDGARQIVRDMRDWNYFPDLISLMTRAETKGLHGRKYHFPHLGHVIQQLSEEGLIYNRSTDSFIEDSRRIITNNWSVLREGESYNFTLLKLDLVKNTSLVRENDQARVEKIFSLVKQDIIEIVQSRMGRLWYWEGDGGLFGFYYGSRREQALYSAMEILHRLFLFNHFTNRLNRPISLRQALINGPLEFFFSPGALKAQETVKRITHLEEELTEPDSVTVPHEIYAHLPKDLHAGFSRKDVPGSEPFHSYRLLWEGM